MSNEKNSLWMAARILPPEGVSLMSRIVSLRIVRSSPPWAGGFVKWAQTG